MLNYISKPDSSTYTTVKLFQGMIDELRENRTEEEFKVLLEHALFIKEKDVRKLKFTHQQFRRLLHFYSQEKFRPEPIHESINLIN